MQQCSHILRMSETEVSDILDIAFAEVSHRAPFKNDDWRNIGVTSEMMGKFAVILDIGLRIFHGKQKSFSERPQ